MAYTTNPQMPKVRRDAVRLVSIESGQSDKSQNT